MVFYHTSMNIKILRNILLDFQDKGEISPYEYMKFFLDNYPENSDDFKLSWISKTFLSIEKHFKFLKDIVVHMSDDISEEDVYYGIIVLHAVTFQLIPKDKDSLYKSLFNISKPLLSTMTTFLSNNEVLSYISQVAQVSYDSQYITENIIAPLFTWQPYISEMAHTYAEYLNKVESRRVKSPTKPDQLNVLNRRKKEIPTLPLIPDTPPNSIQQTHTKNKKMLTKRTIDKRLQVIHEKNKQKGNTLLNEIKNKDYHYARTSKSENNCKPIKYETENDSEKCLSKPRKIIMNNKLPPIKETTATLKKLNKRIKAVEDKELEYLHKLMDFQKPQVMEQLMEQERQERERERLLDVEKKHILGQLSYEEAVLAKNKVYEENKINYQEFLNEKEQWNKEIEKWKQLKIEEVRKSIETMSLNELQKAEAKVAVLKRKKDLAMAVKEKSKELIAAALKNKQEELDERIKMIREIKVLAMITKKAKIPKIIDLTESSGLGLLCEMSIAELQERLAAMKISIKEEIERKKASIKEQNTVARNELDAVKSTIKNFYAERALMKKPKSPDLKAINLEVQSSKEIVDLKKVLAEKRKMRLKLSNENISNT